MRRRPRTALLVLVACALFWLGGAPARADSVGTELEKFIGRQTARSLAEGAGVDTDPLLLRWVQEIGAKVSAEAPRRDVTYTFAILGTDSANALAVPGGYIFVTRGLLDFVESDDELASVLAHETGHIARRHGMQQIGENLLSVVLINSVRGDRYRDARTAASVYAILRALGKSREMEAQADEMGIGYAAAAGYDPEGLIRFFERLDWGRRGNVAEQYLATHPEPARRIASAERDPWVRQAEPAVREAVAAGYAARGLRGAAAAVRRGDRLREYRPARPAPRVPAYVAEDRSAVERQGEELRRSLRDALRARQAGGVLQRALPFTGLFNKQASDLRWLYIAVRAAGVQAQVEDLHARANRVVNTSLPAYDTLAAYTVLPPGSAGAVNASLGRGEVRRALERLGGAPKPIERASKAVLAVLADLNNPLYHPKGGAAWARYGTLEGLLRYAESELAWADKASGQAWRLLALACVRGYEARLNELIPAGDAGRRALWADLAARRFGKAVPADVPAGEATIQTALAVQRGISPEAAAEGRGRTPWADWVLQKEGIPENIATTMRLLTLDLERETRFLDLERETAADDKRQTAAD